MKRLFPFIVLIVLLFTALVSVPFLLRPESHRAEWTNKLSTLLKHPVVLGPLSMIYWPPALRLNQVAVMNDSGAPILQIESVEAVLDVPSLCHLRFVPHTLELNHPVLTASRLQDGSWDLGGWLSGISEVAGNHAIVLSQVSWKSGEVHGMDRYAQAPQELVLGEMDGSWNRKLETLTTGGTFSGIGAPAHISLNAKGQFLAAPQWSGDLQFKEDSHSGSFHLEKHSATLDAKGMAGQWPLTNALAFAKFYARGTALSADSSSVLLLENWQLHVRSEGDRLSFDHTAILAGGVSEIKGTVIRQGGILTAHADIAVKDVSAAAVWLAVGENIPLSGKVTSIAKDVEIVLSNTAADSLKGQGYFELKEGHYKLPDVSLQKLSKAKTMAYLKKKFPDLEQNGIPVTKLSAHWQAKDGKINVTDGSLVSVDMKAEGVGSLDVPRQGVDGYLRLQLHEKDPVLLRLIPEKYRSQAAFGRVQGTWQEWFLRAWPASKIPAGIRSNLK